MKTEFCVKTSGNTDTEDRQSNDRMTLSCRCGREAVKILLAQCKCMQYIAGKIFICA